MDVTEDQVDVEMNRLYQAYDSNWSDYTRYYSVLDWDMRELWSPIIFGCMLGESLKQFFGKFDWSQKDTEIIYDDNGKEIDRFEVEGKYIEPPCGEMPKEVMLCCYHAKRLAPEVIDSLLPATRREALQSYQDQKVKLLYGSDTLSVIEMFDLGF